MNTKHLTLILAIVILWPFVAFSQNWIQIGNDINGEATGDQSGYSVSLSADGNTVAIGAYQNDGNGSNAGHVRVYTRTGSAWVQLGSDIDGEAANDQYGYSVSLSADGSTLAIGAPYNDGSISNAGHVRVFTWSGSAWVQLGSDINGDAANDLSGWAVSMSADGSTVAVGAPYNDGNGGSAGHVKVYTWSGSAWSQIGSDIDGEAGSDRSGWSVSLSADGSSVAIGAIDNDANGNNAGHVRVYNWSGSAWVQTGSDIDGEAAEDQSGWSISLSADGSTVAIGAIGNDGNGTNAGHVRVFTWSGSAWVQLGNDIDGEASIDLSGRSVSLSADGSILAIGAIYNDGNGNNSGHVRVFTWSGSAWVQAGSDIDGEAPFDQSGYSVCLSTDGKTVAIGAPFNAGSSSNSGHVRVYEFEPGVIEWTGAVGTTWYTGPNWSGSSGVQNGDNVLIPTGLTNYPVVTTDPVVNDLEVETGATLLIPSGESLTVQGVLTNDGTITVESGGSLVQESGSTLAGSGTYSVQRDKPSGVSFISSPIENIAVNGFGISPTGNNGGQIIPNTSNPCNPDSIDITSDYGNLLELRENPSVISNCAQSLWFVKSTGNLTDGRGYSLNSGATTLDFSGTINNGTVTYSGLTRQSGTIDQQDGSTSTRGWHLVGNPYPSPITLVGADLTGMGFDAQIQRYNDATGSWFSNDPLVSATIAVGQGFQIRKTSVGGSADFELDNDFRTAGNPTFYRQQAPREYYLSMTLDNDSMTDESMIYFYDGATDGFDALYDANRLMGKITNPHLYTVADDERLSYNAYALMQPEETKTVPVGVHSGVYGQFTLTFNNLNTLDAVVTLEDTKLGTFTELTDGYTYTFTTVEGDANERFLLHFAQNKEEQPVGIDIITQEDIKLYPNPTSDNITIELPKEHQFNQAVILNVAGQQVMNITDVDDKTTLPLNTTKLSEGIYYIKLQGAYSTTLRFIKL